MRWPVPGMEPPEWMTAIAIILIAVLVYFVVGAGIRWLRREWRGGRRR